MLTAAMFDWAQFKGSDQALRYARRDLPGLDAVIALVPQHRVAVQAGGNLGIWPKRLAAAFEQVVTFEPAADLFAVMMHNAPETNIIRFQAALGDRPGQMVGTSRARRDGSGKPTHEGLTHVDGAGPIPTIRLDDLLLPTVDLLCLDVEGYELYALRGATDTLQRCRPVVAVEINQHIAAFGEDPNDVRVLMQILGYRFVMRLASDEVYVPTEFPA